ncbi:disulfide bond formation protein B [Ovoidimarina sediminis]|uniref:disulfide bond formation protein B n=1 Tax=Ovoidimarina sediminis TaxID=3079856 RepID=UPI00290E2211|nr:disulfide bond formation protein B [Rhodophyticola sp. MJ-SS7]MDU8941968.1 disulfide bond formation protein B [Rhodophyticola sp. MJ-SS7]
MTRRSLILMAAGGSLALLLGAWAFQHIGGLAPCKLCIWQRWPHGAAVLIGGAGLFVGGAVLPLLGALAAAATAGVGVYHTGVEREWWEGPTSCSSGSIEGLTPEQLMDQIMGAPLVQCDQVAWEMLGLSMASWNAVLSVAFVTLWLAAAVKSRA